MKNRVAKNRSEASSISPKESFRVSQNSLWGDPVWRLDTETPGQRNFIGWRFELPDGSNSTDEQHLTLLEGFREVFWGLLNNVGTYGKALSPGSAAPIGTGIRELFRWMVLREYRSFSQLNRDAHAHYLRDIPILLADPSLFYSSGIGNGEHAAVDECDDVDSDTDTEKSAEIPENVEPDDRFTYGQVAYRINTLYYIFSQEVVLSARGIPCMLEKPFLGKSAGDVVSTVVKHAINRIPPLPSEVAAPLLKSSLDWVEHKAEDVLRLQALYFEKRREHVQLQLPKKVAGEGLFAALRDYQFSCLPGESTAWRESLTTETSCNPSFGERRLNQLQILRQLILTTRAACINVLQYLVGLRIGEVCAIKGGWDKERHLPECVSVQYSKSGVMEMFFLESTISKGVRQPRQDKWLLGSRPVGSAVLPATVKALCVLERLYRPWRQFGALDSLIVAFAQPRSVPQTSSSVKPISAPALLRGAKEFMFREVDLADLPDRNERGENLAMYRDSLGLCLRTHQGRKTFIAYVLQTRSSLLSAVSQHFKHLEIATTERGYYHHLTRIQNEADSVVAAETISFFVSVLQGRKIEGRMAELVKRYLSSADWKTTLGYAELEEKVAHLVHAHDLRIFFADHGHCLISVNPTQSRCRELGSGATWSAVTPNYAARTPSNCSGCGCFVVDSSNLPFWLERESSLSALLSRASSSGLTREYRVHKMSLEQARKVVRLLKKHAQEA